MEHTWTTLSLALLTGVVAVAVAAVLRRRGVIRVAPLRYVPHLVFLCTVAAAPVLMRGGTNAWSAASVFAGVAIIWLAALWVLSRTHVSSSASRVV